MTPATAAAANADLYGAYEKEEPWLGYQWGTNDPRLLLDLVRLEEPAYSDECWFTTKACAYEDATILIAVGPDILSRAPDVVAMLRNWGFDIDLTRRSQPGRVKTRSHGQRLCPVVAERQEDVWRAG